MIGKRCVRHNCKKITAYSRLENAYGKVKERNYCAEHWKSDVESKPEFKNQVRRWEKSIASASAKPQRKKRRVKVKR